MRRLLPALLLAACTPATPPSDDAILALGDSIMAWNGDAGIPEVTAAALGRPVVDASRSGARLTTESGLAAAAGFDIAAQFRGEGWDWVILTGGGNDIRRACATPAAAGARDALIGPDLAGEIPTLLDRIQATGARVAFLGYYDGAAAAPPGAAPCQPEFDIIHARLARFAAGRPGIIFVDAGDVVDPAETGLYDRDLLHPSPTGSQVVGQALARAIRRAEGS
jgi:lysophospholipase L1-like esterase